MTLKRRRLIVGTAVAGLVAVTGWGYVAVADDIHTYDQRFSDCVEVHKALIPMPYRYDFRSEDHQAMMADCERQANDQ